MILLAVLGGTLFIGTGLADDGVSNQDRKFLPELVNIAKEDGSKIYSICEICNGVSETAFIRESSRCHNTYSVAKLFVVTTLGILEDQGKLDIDEPVYPIFEKKFPKDFDPKWRQVKISDVIRHRIGFGQAGFLDIDAENAATWPNRDFLSILLSCPLQYEPGEKFVYTDAAFYLASRIVSEKSGERLSDFMIRELLEPLKFAEYAFSTCPEGYPIGATGMYISTEDMAKLGLLYVQRGVYDGRRILSERFVDEAFDRTFELFPIGDTGDAFLKGGMAGQLLYMNRKTKRVVAVHSFNGDIDAIIRFLTENDY